MSAAAGGGVLAAIEDSINECNDVTCPQCRRLAKARTAVAELIEAAKAFRDSVTLRQEREAIERLDAALSNIEGGQ